MITYTVCTQSGFANERGNYKQRLNTDPILVSVSKIRKFKISRLISSSQFLTVFLFSGWELACLIDQFYLF